MVAAEAQKKEELERLLVAQKSIVVSSRERINVLEGTGNSTELMLPFFCFLFC